MSRGRRGRLQGLAAFLGSGAATVALTWPLAASWGTAISVRGDYQVALWNAWWIRRSLFELGTSPFATDFLHFPAGISLVNHTLSLTNAVPGALLSLALSLEDANRALLLAHFWLSAWAMFLFAREMTGSAGGAGLAGLVWAFHPYSAYYLGQLNLVALGFLPLLGLFVVRTWRRGGAGSALGLVATAGLLAACDGYYLVYGALLGAILLLGSRGWAPDVAWRTGLRRVLPAVLGSALAVGVASAPLLAAAFAGGGGGGTPVDRLASRSDDLLGFLWFGGPERVIVSWPTLIGYATLLLLLLGWRGVVRRPLWLCVAAVGFVLGLGPELTVAGERVGVPLPYRLLAELPVLGMLRKPDRFVVFVLLAAAMLSAWAWRDLAARLPGRRARLAAGLAFAAAIAIESAPAPLETFPVAKTPYLDVLRRDPTVETLVDLPTGGGSPSDARANRAQTRHEKKIPQGYVTSLALTREHLAAMGRWGAAYRALRQGDATWLRERAWADGIDVVLLRKSVPRLRAAGPLDGTTVWVPFRAVRRELVGMRQRGHLTEQPVPGPELERQLAALTATFGPAAYEDERMAVFRVPPRRAGD